MFGCGCRSSHHRPLETPRYDNLTLQLCNRPITFCSAVYEPPLCPPGLTPAIPTPTTPHTTAETASTTTPHAPAAIYRMEASPVPSVGSDDGIRHDSWTSGSGGEFVGVGSGSSADENVEKASTDKGYKDIISSWNESVIHATPSIIWQSS
jgi:hypothetical protein